MNSFVKILYPKKYLINLDKKLKRLGMDNKMKIDTFLVTRLILEFIIFIGLLLIPIYGIFLSFLFTILFHYLYEDMLINSRLIKRSIVIKDNLEEFLKLYIMGLSKNKDAYLVFKTVSKNIDNDLTKELNYLIKKYNNYNDIVNNLIKVIPEYSFSDSILMLSNGSIDIPEMIVNNIEDDKNVSIEKKINSIPIKIILLSIIFLILVLLIILVGPKYL